MCAFVFTEFSFVFLIWLLIGISILYSLVLFAMSMLIGLNFFIESINENTTNNVVFTFDDGPHPEHTPKILTILKEFNVKAVFFVIGKNAKENPELIKQIVKEGHQIGTHSMNHKGGFGFLMGGNLKKEISNAAEVVKNIVGERPLLFRSPFGVTNPLIANEVTAQNLISVGWSVRSFDTPAKSIDEIIGRVVPKIKPNSIVLLHDRMPLTVKALPQMIEQIKGKGFAMGKLETNQHA